MTDRTWWDSFKADGGDLLERLKEAVHQGNVRRIVIKQQGRSVAEFPVTAGVVGALLAPMVAAIGTLVALLKDCTIHIEREGVVPPTVENSGDTEK